MRSKEKDEPCIYTERLCVVSVPRVNKAVKDTASGFGLM